MRLVAGGWLALEENENEMWGRQLLLVREFSTSVCVSAYDMPAWLNFHKEVTRPIKNHSARLFYFEISIYIVIVVIVCGWVGIITIASSFQCHAHIY
jgi:hypothetical protein